MDDLKNLEFLAVNSKENIEKQVDSYRQQHTYAGTIIGAIALFIPFFLGGFDGTSQMVQFITVLPVACFICAIFLMLSIFRTKPLDQAFNVNKYKELMQKSYKEILLFEIEANSTSYCINRKITERDSIRYSNGVSLTIFALLCSIVLITASKLTTIEKAPTKVQVVNVRKTAGDSSHANINTLPPDVLVADPKPSNK